MRELDLGALAPDAGCALVARGSRAAPDFLIGDNAGDQLRVARWRRGAVPLTEPRPMAEHLLSYCVAGAAACTVRADGTRLHAQQRPRSLTLLRAGQAVQWQLEVAEDVEHIHLYLSPDAVAAHAPDLGPHGEAPRLQNLMGLRDAWLDSFFRLLINEVESCARDARLADSLFLDQTAGLLVSYLVSRYAEGAPRSAGASSSSRVSALRPALLRRVEAYIDENLGGRLRLAGMAGVAAMSIGHFSRAFHLATGLSPHQYVLARRLERARALLREPATPISAIARRCGFSGAAHFSVAFRQHHALTPSQYRQMQ